MKTSVAAGVIAVVLCGCGDAPEPDPPEPPEIAAPGGSPVKIVAVDRQDAFGIQHRDLRVVVPVPDSKEAVLEALRPIYETAVKNINLTDPAAEQKLITILVYDSEEDAEDLLEIGLLSTGESAELPAFDDVKQKWSWRDPASRPDAADRALYVEYWRGIQNADRLAESSRIVGSADALAPLEPQRKFRREAVSRLCDAHQRTRGQLGPRVARVRLWKQGAAVSPEAVQQEWRRMQLDEPEWAAVHSE